MNHKWHWTVVVCFVVNTIAIAEDNFEPPVPLKADGEYIDTGSTGGHSGPCLVDLDKDGLLDLVVGDYKGKFRYFRNEGAAQSPEYKFSGYLQSEGADAEVLVYCCIGASPYFCDLNGDGAMDMLTGCYSPGTIWFFPGIKDGENPLELGSKRQLKDVTGKLIRSPHASWPTTYDIDSDGDLDLIYGSGFLHIRLNVGTRQEPKFAAEEMVVGETMINGVRRTMIPRGHSAAAVADWNRDGLPDLLSGCSNGGVYCFLNKGTKTEPKFDDIINILEPIIPQGHGLRIPRIDGAKPQRGIRSQIFATDYNNDGWDDLLLGDYDLSATYTLKKDATPQEADEFEKLALERFHLEMALWVEGSDYYSIAKRAFKGTDEEFSVAWKEKIKPEWQAAPPQTNRKDRMEEIGQLMPKYLDADKTHPRHIDHGYVWVYLGKARTINQEASIGKASPTMDDAQPKMTSLFSAPKPTEENPIQWGVRVRATESGENLSVACELGVQMAQGFHIGPMPAEAKFEMPTRIDIEFPAAFSSGELVAPKTVMAESASGPQKAYEGDQTFRQTFTAPKSKVPASFPVKVTITYVACTAQECMHLTEKSFDLTVAPAKLTPAVL